MLVRSDMDCPDISCIIQSTSCMEPRKMTEMVSSVVAHEIQTIIRGSHLKEKSNFQVSLQDYLSNKLKIKITP